MHGTPWTGTMVISAAVVIFVLFLMLLVVVVDHKARIPGAIKRDLFSLTGRRTDHPLWSYVIGTVLLLIIGGIALELGAAVVERLPVKQEKPVSALLGNLEAKRKSESARHFHNPANTFALEGRKSVCFYCHGDFPHFQERMIRTLLNMHTQFIGCMTCHADSEKVDEGRITLRWLNYSGIEVSGPRFGTDHNPETGFLVPTDDYYSKIVPYLSVDGEEQLLEITEDDPMAVDFVNVQAQLTGRDREEVKKSFHTLVMPKGRFCTRCHAQPGASFLPFAELGFSERRVNELTSLNIIGLVQKYKEFYMPDLMEREVAPIVIDSPMGTETKSLPIRPEAQ